MVHNSPHQTSTRRTGNYSEMVKFIENDLRARIKKAPEFKNDIDLTAAHYTMTHSEIWSCIYGAPLTLEFLEGDYFRIQFHINGQGSTRIGRNEFIVCPDQAVISSADAQIRFGPDFRQTVLRLSKKKLMNKMTALVGVVLPRPLEFENTFNPLIDRYLILKNKFDFLLSNISSKNLNVPTLVLDEMEQVLFTAFLTCCNHNFTDLLSRESVSAAPWQVRLVEQYIEEHWNKPIRMSDIHAITNCSARSLFRAFQKSRGYSPMQFAKKIRLEHSRKMLVENEMSNVTDVALACGFVDMGRFSSDYGQKFGELPSHTLRQKKHM